MTDQVKGVNADLYNALVSVARNAARVEAKLDDTLTEGIRAAVQADDLATFDRTFDFFTKNMRKQDLPVPLAIERMHVVVHEAVEKGVPLSDENGVPRHFSELREATAKKRRKRRTKKANRAH